MQEVLGELIPENSSEGKVNKNVFRTVSGAWLLAHWTDLEEAHAPVLQIQSRSAQVLHVSVLTRTALESLTDAERELSNFAVPSRWLAGNQLKQFHLGWDRDPFFLRWHALLDLLPEKRIEALRKGRAEVEESLKHERDPVSRAKLIASVTETAFLANKACMSLEKSALGANDQELVHETILVVQAVLSSIEESKVSSALLLAFRSISSGQVIDHVVRVFTLGSAFLLYLKKIHTQNFAVRLRTAFPNLYKAMYLKLLPQIPESRLTSDNLIRLKSYSEKEIREQALGMLLHDLGKAMDLGYFESAGPYEKTRIQQHSILGSGLFLRTYGQKFEQARYIIGDHHNYLFHPDGYGLTRWDRSRGGRGQKVPVASVGDSLENYEDGEALAFLPIEACSLCDVYDALTDPIRPDKRVRSPSQAIEVMAREFVREGKLDPVLFDLFVGFLKTTGVETPWPDFEDRVRTRLPWSLPL